MTYTMPQRRNTRITGIQSTVIIGLILRLIVLLFVLFLAEGFVSPYFLSDDRSYEALAYQYQKGASGIIDFSYFNALTKGYASVFWPFVMCVTAKLFGTYIAGRYVNVVLSTICIYVVYLLTREISENEKVALRAAKLFAYLPVTVLVCCFPIKDIFLTLGVFYAFYIFVMLQKGYRLSFRQVATCAVLLICVYFTRGAVTELLLLFMMVYYLQRLIRARNTGGVLLLLLAFLVAAVLFAPSVMTAFQTKFDIYQSYGSEEASGLNTIRFTGLRDIYKLPFAYVFATLQPLKLNLFAQSSNFWINLMVYGNLAIYPVALGNFLYVFSKKKNLFFWLSTFVMYVAVIMLSLGVFRHYLFLLPIEMINFSQYIDQEGQNGVQLVTFGTVGVFILVLVYSFLNLA